MLIGCKTIQYVPIEHTEYVHQLDSVYFRDTVIQYQIEKEYIRDFTGMLDTLRMETAYSKFASWVDTSSAKLSGTAVNKSENVINVPVSVKEKVIVKDSIVYKDVPVPVEVVKTVHPAYEKWLWVYAFVSLALLGLWLLLKFRLKV